MKMLLIAMAFMMAPPQTARYAGYDPKRDPAKDLEAAIVEAQRDNKRILLVIGGEWCGWCHILENYLKANDDVRKTWNDNYVSFKVNWSGENRNEAFLKGYPDDSRVSASVRAREGRLVAAFAGYGRARGRAELFKREGDGFPSSLAAAAGPGAMTAQDARLLVDYHYWARDRLLQAVEPLTPEQYTRDMGNSFRSVRDTVVHIYSGEWVWFPDGRANRRRCSCVRRRIRISRLCARRGSAPDEDDGVRRAARRQDTARVDRLPDDRRSTLDAAALAHAPARRQSRHLSSRPGDDDAAAARRRGSQESGFDRFLSPSRLIRLKSGSCEIRFYVSYVSYVVDRYLVCLNKNLCH